MGRIPNRRLRADIVCAKVRGVILLRLAVLCDRRLHRTGVFCESRASGNDYGDGTFTTRYRKGSLKRYAAMSPADGEKRHRRHAPNGLTSERQLERIAVSASIGLTSTSRFWLAGQTTLWRLLRHPNQSSTWCAAYNCSWVQTHGNNLSSEHEWNI